MHHRALRSFPTRRSSDLWNNKLRGSLADRSANGQQGFMKALMEGAEKFGKDVDINDEHVGMGIATQAELEAGSQINPYARLLEHKADLFGRVHSSFRSEEHTS